MAFMPWALFGAALLGDFVLLALFWRGKKSKRTLDVTAQDLLHDLTRRGSAILRVDLIDPANLLLRSPRR